MTTSYGNPFWDEPKRQAPQKDPWYAQPVFYAYLTASFIVAMIALANGVFIQSLCGAVALAIATGWYQIVELHTLEDIRDPFTS